MDVVTSPARWTISVRSSGEVLAVQASGSGLELSFLGAPPGFDEPEIEGWLTELISMVGMAANGALPAPGSTPSIPIPRVLHQALTGLLFYEAELWGEPRGREPCAVVLVSGDEEVALGWSGSGRVEVTKDGRPFEPVWIEVRDERGRRACAFVADARSRLGVRALWGAAAGGAEPPGGMMEAEWPGLQEEMLVAGADPCGGELAGHEQTAPAASPAASAVPDEQAGESRPHHTRGLWRFRSWMDRLAGSPVQEEAQSGPAPWPEPIAHDVPGVPDLIPEASPISETRAAQPPTPEPVVVAAPVATSGQAIAPFDFVVAVATGPEPTPQPTDATAAAATGPEPPPERVDALPAAACESEQALQPAVAEPATPPETHHETQPQGVVVGMVASEAATVRPRPSARRPAWPEPEDLARAAARPFWQRSWFIAAIVVMLFGAGWLLGRVDLPRRGGVFVSAFKAMGLHPARYELTVTSRPAGAWITLDGVDLARRTPATLELKPGAHEIVLSMSGVGGSSHKVVGKRGQRVALDVELWGALKVSVPGGSGPIAVAVDGMPRGDAPLDVDRLAPGIHRLQFSGPGVAPWEQTVEVHVNRATEIVAQPVTSPPTGLLEVRATLADEAGSEPLAGATVWIDGQLRGATPLKLELPRGPHSIRVRYRGEDAPVRVIELPGGNVRYATFELGLGEDHPRLVAALAGSVPLDRPSVLAASLDRLREGDVREMWLHVRTPEGAWRRYPMTVMKATGGLVGVAVFPTALFDARGRTAWYASAATPTGDEYFTEIRPAQATAKP